MEIMQLKINIPAILSLVIFRFNQSEIFDSSNPRRLEFSVELFRDLIPDVSGVDLALFGFVSHHNVKLSETSHFAIHVSIVGSEATKSDLFALFLLFWSKPFVMIGGIFGR